MNRISRPRLKWEGPAVLIDAPFTGGAPQHEDLSHARSSPSSSCHPWDRHWQNSFYLVGLDERGAIVLRQKLSRDYPMPACDGAYQG